MWRINCYLSCVSSHGKSGPTSYNIIEVIFLWHYFWNSITKKHYDIFSKASNSVEFVWMIYVVLFSNRHLWNGDTHKSIGDKFIQMVEKLKTRIVYVDIALQSKSTSHASASATSPVDGEGSIIVISAATCHRQGLWSKQRNNCSKKYTFWSDDDIYFVFPRSEDPRSFVVNIWCWHTSN